MRVLLRRGIIAAALGLVAAATLGASALVADAYVPSTSADPSDGAALVHEAIANVRGMERFRFTEVIGAGGTAIGAVDLSPGSDDPPRLWTKTDLHGMNGEPMPVETVVVGDEARTQPPRGDGFR